MAGVAHRGERSCAHSLRSARTVAVRGEVERESSVSTKINYQKLAYVGTSYYDCTIGTFLFTSSVRLLQQQQQQWH